MWIVSPKGHPCAAIPIKDSTTEWNILQIFQRIFEETDFFTAIKQKALEKKIDKKQESKT